MPIWTFEQIAGRAFALDPDVRWVSVTRPGIARRWSYRPGIEALNADISDEAEERLVNPTLLTLAGGRGDWDLGGLKFIIVGYGVLTQLIAKLPAGGHISLSLDQEVNAYELGRKLTMLLESEIDR